MCNKEDGLMKRKILFIIWSYTFGGGAEALLTMIVNHLNPEKYDISIIEYHHAEIKTEPVNENIHVLPYIQAVDTPEKYSKTYQLYHMPELLIDTYIKKDYDLYISFNYLIPTFLLPKGTKNISWIHGNVYDLADKQVLRERKRQDIAFYKVKKIVVISDLTEQSLKELFPNHQEKLVKIYNGVDINKIKKKADEAAEIKIEHPSIVFIGRLEEAKDPIRLLNVLKLVHKYGIKAHLYYLGSGELRDVIFNEATEKGVADFIHLLGYKQNPFPIIKQCNVTCLLSKGEGFSMSLLESVALGIPFVATKVGGANELSNNQSCGSTIETDEEAALSIYKWIITDREEIKRKCAESIKRFSLNDYIHKIEMMFDEVMDGN